MTLSEQTRLALAKLPAFASGRRTLEVDEGGQHFTCDLTALDTLACEFTRFALESEKRCAAEIDELQRLSEALAARVTYLLEPIHPVEVDAEQCAVQMRSNPPQRDDDRTSYYELLVRRGGEISLCRYVKEAGDQRRAVPAQVTREVFLRLVGDFSAVAG